MVIENEWWIQGVLSWCVLHNFHNKQLKKRRGGGGERISLLAGAKGRCVNSIYFCLLIKQRDLALITIITAETPNYTDLVKWSMIQWFLEGPKFMAEGKGSLKFLMRAAAQLKIFKKCFSWRVTFVTIWWTDHELWHLLSWEGRCMTHSHRNWHCFY